MVSDHNPHVRGFFRPRLHPASHITGKPDLGVAWQPQARHGRPSTGSLPLPDPQRNVPWSEPDADRGSVNKPVVLREITAVILSGGETRDEMHARGDPPRH